MTDNRFFPRAGVRFALATSVVLATTLLTAAGAQATPPPPKPTLLSQVPFVIPATPDAGALVNTKATVWHLPPTVDAAGVIAWITCQGKTVPSAYPVTKTVDHSTGRLLLTAVMTSGRTDTACVLNAVSTAIGTHVSFYPFSTDPRTGELDTDADYVIEGITVP